MTADYCLKLPTLKTFPPNPELMKNFIATHEDNLYSPYPVAKGLRPIVYYDIVILFLNI